MSFPLEIIPNRGLGHILFGNDPDKVRSEIGVPTSNNDRTGLNKPPNKIWFYDDPNCNFLFYPGDFVSDAWVGSKKPRLVIIGAWSPRFTLFGEQIIGEAEQVMRMRLEGHGLTDPRNVAREEDPSLWSSSHKHLTYEDANLHVYLVDQVVTCIQWGSFSGPFPGLTQDPENLKK